MLLQIEKLWEDSYILFIGKIYNDLAGYSNGSKVVAKANYATSAGTATNVTNTPSHNHDNRYFTETEVNNKFTTLQNNLGGGNWYSINGGNGWDLTYFRYARNALQGLVFMQGTLDGTNATNSVVFQFESSKMPVPWGMPYIQILDETNMKYVSIGYYVLNGAYYFTLPTGAKYSISWIYMTDQF